MIKRKSFQISEIEISENRSPFIIAELSGNHNGSIKKARKLIKAAADSGVNAIKLQTYTADTMTIPSTAPDFQISNGLWKGKSLYELYEWAHTPWQWHKELFDYANELGLIAFSSPFDETAVDFLETLNVPAYKIASFELTDIPLIKKVASTGKPIILSTGMASLEDIQLAIKCIQKTSESPFCLLHCVSGYPTPLDDINLRGIELLKEKFSCPVGLSDHTLTTLTSVCATSMGASIIEKHITLNRGDGSPDSEFSLEPKEFTRLCQDVKSAFSCLGHRDKVLKESEKGNIQFRRSIYVVKDIKKNQLLTKENIRIIRPSYGLAPKNYEGVIGCRVNQDIKSGTPLSHSLITQNINAL